MSCQSSAEFGQHSVAAMTRHPHKSRSTNRDDYQDTPRPVAAMSKTFEDGFEITPHHHPRDQFVYAVTGVMRVRTQAQAWIIPPDRAVYLPAYAEHSISMRGLVTMSTLYIERNLNENLPVTPTVLEVSHLLLARLFEKEVGLSFIAWRQRVRFHNALEAITAGKSISTVALRSGYRSPSAFAAAFRGVMGQAPSSFARPAS